MREIRECNVAVVGGAGFLGSHLVNHLINDRNCKVLVVDNLCAGRREFVHKSAEFLHHDITGSEDRLRRAFEAFGARYAFNYAAWPYIPDSFARPIHVSDVNYLGAVKVINAAQEASCEAVLQVSSAEIYGDGDAGSGALGDNFAGRAEDGTICGFKRLNESAPVRPHSTYGVAKAAVDSFVQCAWRERRTPCIALRQFNCVGERETHPYIVPEIISQLSNQMQAYRNADKTLMDGLENTPGVQVVERGGLRNLLATVKLGNNSFRDFLYAGDAVRIAVELLERGQFGEVYNLGSETGIKMYDLAKLIGEVMWFADVQVAEDEARKRPWEIWHLLADNRKLLSLFAEDELFTLTPLEEALRRAVADFERSGRKWCWQ